MFSASTTSGFLQISSTQPTPNSDEKRELDVAFLTHGVHVNVELDSGDDVEELPTPVAGQGSKCEMAAFQHTCLSSCMTDAIMKFMDMSMKRRSNKDIDIRKETVEFASVGDRFSMDKVVAILNSIETVDDYTMFKVLNELYKLDSKAAIIMLRSDGRRVWMDLVSSLM